MDTAGSELLASALSSQGARLSLQEEQLVTLSHGVKGLALSQEDFKAAVTAQIGDLAEQIQRLLEGPRGSVPEPPAPEPSPMPSELEFDWHLLSDIQEIWEDVSRS